MKKVKGIYTLEPKDLQVNDKLIESAPDMLITLVDEISFISDLLYDKLDNKYRIKDVATRSTMNGRIVVLKEFIKGL